MDNFFFEEVGPRGLSISRERLVRLLEDNRFYLTQPTIGVLFKVTPREIDQSIFHEKWKLGWHGDKNEETRQLILEAFEEAERNPEYMEPFHTLVPREESSGARTVKELRSIARRNNGKLANWVEQALEWAQRIYNYGEYGDIINAADYMSVRRAVIWKDGKTIKYCGGGSYGIRYEIDYIQDKPGKPENHEVDVPLIVLRP